VPVRRSILWSLPCLLLALGPASSEAQIERSVGQDGVIDLNNNKSRGETVKRRTGTVPVLPAHHAGRNATRFDEYIHEAAALYRLPEGLIRAVIKVESNFDPRAVSHANAHGLMQLLPSTAERMMVTDIFDPRQNILGGTRYLRILANTFNGNLELTLAGYNAGEGAVARYGGIPPYAETQNYVAKVTQYYQLYR
jgi:soluble lytic murein transglycosylase-like protein